jgi:hypothetical protein
MRRILLFGIFLVVAGVSDASAQLPFQISVNGGVAIPMGNEKDTYDNGLHVGVALKAPIIPLQLEAGYDKFAAKTDGNEDFSALSGGLAIPFGITPPLLPVGLYVVVGGGLYRHEAETKATDFGLNGGLGVRVGIPTVVTLFGEARGVTILDEVNQRTYVTASIGIRF